MGVAALPFTVVVEPWKSAALAAIDLKLEVLRAVFVPVGPTLDLPLRRSIRSDEWWKEEAEAEAEGME